MFLTPSPESMLHPRRLQKDFVSVPQPSSDRDQGMDLLLILQMLYPRIVVFPI